MSAEDIERIADQLQAQTPGLSRADALKLAERAIPSTI